LQKCSYKPPSADYTLLSIFETSKLIGYIPYILQITIPLSKKLIELKETLAETSYFGPISVDHQRIFHLGRELKSGGRSLQKLGLGRFNNHVLHLHIPPNDHDIRDETSLSASGTTASGKRRRNGTEAFKNNNNSDGVIDLLDDSEDDEALIDGGEDKRPRVS
jgi:hypothetical protein